MSKEDDEEANDFIRVLQLNNGSILGMVMKAAIELYLFEIMAKTAAFNGTSPFGDNAKMLSSDDIVAHLPTQNPAATSMLERILRFLAANSILIRTVVVEDDGKEKSLYSLASICKHYIADEDGVSLAPLLLMLHDKVPVLDGGIPFNKAHDGMHAFEYPAKDGRYNDVFNQAIVLVKGRSTKMSKEVEDANEFARVLQLNSGTILGMIMKAVIELYLFEIMAKAASPSGDDANKLSSDDIVAHRPTQNPAAKAMLERILRVLASNSILIRTVVVEEDGKVVIVESVVPNYKNAGCSSKLSNVMDNDMIMLALNPGGNERSLKEFEALAKQSGFAVVQFICKAAVYSVLEFHKKV
ncbi:Caffeic acid 3-O-methyltransferase [Heracleum sosnowskyi]|uniref:Caffeic acid 3-O-methyltransferase n=1 Tax=Heracleum sosnowskyi TaxID=360622 RepID=A0AAD8GQH9_9APIA|nr:Caffeic acid 3-O-methyltransferase [Heracleum sosnowskyi]